MSCPVCKKKMQGESSRLVKYPYASIPAANYRCEECDSEYQWIKGTGLILIDEAAREL